MKYTQTEPEYRAFAARWNHLQQQEAKPSTAGTIRYAKPLVSEIALININQAALRREFQKAE